MADCFSLQGSTRCPAFASAYISPSAAVGQYNFLNYVSDRASFDSELGSFVQTTFVNEQFVARIGCQGINLSNTSNLYPRYLTSTICSAIVQSSISTCSLASANSKPLCADTCAEYAESELYIVEDSNTCASATSDAIKLIKSDFVTCSSPDNSLSSDCISGSDNEPDNCGYGNSTIGLCSYCSSGGINSTDTCCYSSQAESRCAGVVLPTITSTLTFTTITASPTSSADATPSSDTDSKHGLSGGAIAGIVVGVIGGLALLAGLIFLALLALRRRRNGSQNGSIFNQPSPARKVLGPQMTHTAASSSQGNRPFGVLPGGRIARMSALEGDEVAESPTPPRPRGSSSAVATGAISAYAVGRSTSRRRGDDLSSSDGYNDSPDSENRTGILRPPPTTNRRHGSLSSGSVLAGEDPQSPSSAGMSSPQAITSQQSEQLPFFKDYYSQDDIHPGDRVAVLWAYQPRAADEFTLERGDMLKVVGIWDDGWATGVMVDERADEWETRRQAQRDSGVSNTSGRGRDISPAVSGEIKAFPLVCVCLPEHWRKTIEGDGSTETGSSAHPGL
ncbi:sh3 domain-containing protein [Ophiostoma piceae UAMH 11346]|uniref:Sh3 domain-containing protein n=1 Tax=Ophiostoma piceae (strain UAMH 11346) TaxID=1262450 RepID=S3CAP8_OPHP1|nr:sh3 domain-containing protein [Ophiostoma piceae UAMH 11346]